MESLSFMSHDIESHFEFHASANLRHPKWRVQADELMRQLRAHIQHLCQDYQQAPVKKDHRLFQMSPILCGLILYHFRAPYSLISLIVVECWSLVLSCQRLYNALQQQKLADHQWRDMEVLLHNLGEDSFFVGGEKPKTPHGWFKSHVLQKGISATGLARQGRPSRRLKASKAGPRRFKDNAPVQSMFERRFADGTHEVKLTPEDVYRIIDLSLFELVGHWEDGAFKIGKIQDPAKLKEKKKAWHDQKQGISQRRHKKAVEGGYMAPEQLLDPLLVALQAETVEFGFPYLTLHRSCRQLMHEINNACNTVLWQTLYAKSVPPKSNDLFVVNHILTAAAANHGKIALRPLELSAERFNMFMASGLGETTCNTMEKLGMLPGFEKEAVEGEKVPDGTSSDAALS
jgi:hypothetical protein